MERGWRSSWNELVVSIFYNRWNGSRLFQRSQGHAPKQPFSARALMVPCLGYCFALCTMLVAVKPTTAEIMPNNRDLPLGQATKVATWGDGVNTYLQLPHKLLVETVAWSPDGKLLAALDDWSNRINVWEVASGTRVYQVSKKSDISKSLTFTRDSKALVVQSLTAGFADKKTSLSVLNAFDGGVLRTIEGPPVARGSNAARVFSLSPDGRYLAMSPAGDPSRIEIYDAGLWREIQTLYWRPNDGLAMAFSPDSQLLAVGGFGGSVLVCRVPSGECQETLKLQPSTIFALAFSPDSSVLLAGIISARWGASREDLRNRASLDEADRHQIRAFDVRARHGAGEINAVLEGVQSLSFHPSGRFFAAGGGNAVSIFDASSYRLLESLHGFSQVKSVAFSPDGRRLAVGSNGFVTIVEPSK